MKRDIEVFILKILEYIFPKPVFDKIIIGWRRRVNRVTGYYPDAVFFSKKKSNKKYCVVRYATPTFGIMAAGIQYIFCYYKLINRGYIPVLDLEYEFSYKKGRIGEHGMWDLCFEQTMTAKDVRNEKYVLATGGLFDYSKDEEVSEWLNGDREDHFLHTKKDDFREYYAKAKKIVEPIWQVKRSILEELDDEIGNELREHRVLGVFLRENFSNDIVQTERKDIEIYSNHPLLPTVDEIVDIIKNDLNHWNFEKIYVSATYSESVSIMRREFGDQVIGIHRTSELSKKDRELGFSNSDIELYDAVKKNNEWYCNKNISYVKDLVALSKCTYFLGGPCSGSATALTMNGGKYEDIYILEDRRKITRY